MKKIFQKNSKTILYLALLLIVYLPYIFSVGYSPGDDSFHVYFIQENPSIFENIKQNLSISPARPVSGIILGFAHGIIENNIVIYNLISFSLWIISGLILRNSFKLIINKEFSKIFFLIFSFPYLCFSIFLGNHVWAGYILFIFFWSIAFYFQIKFYNNKKNIYFVFFSFFLIISIFTFELIISLLIINILIPIFFKANKKNFILNFIIVLLFALLYFFFKTYFLPSVFNTTVYGYSEVNITTFLQSVYFFYAISVENIILLLSSLKYSLNFFSIILFLCIFFIFKNFKKNLELKSNLIFIIFFLSFISCFLIFLISGYPAVTYGHYNKTLVAAFLCFSFIISYLFLYFNVNKYFIILFIFLVINSTYIQIKNHAEATKIKKNLIKQLIINIKKNDIKSDDIILVNSNLFVKNNYNNEEIVFTTWDLKFRILNKTKKNINFWLINDRLVNDVGYYPVANFMNSDYLRKESSKKVTLFYFEYNEKFNSFVIFNDKNDILKKIKYLKDNKINPDRYILREKIRLRLKKIIYEIL
jgi:hypothetical protein